MRRAYRSILYRTHTYRMADRRGDKKIINNNTARKRTTSFYRIDRRGRRRE